MTGELKQYQVAVRFPEDQAAPQIPENAGEELISAAIAWNEARFSDVIASVKQQVDLILQKDNGKIIEYPGQYKGYIYVMATEASRNEIQTLADVEKIEEYTREKIKLSALATNIINSHRQPRN